MKVALLVLNYNGEQLLRECLHSIVEASRKTEHDARVIVIDNCSTDNSLQVLKSDFKDVEVIKAKENRFLVSYNEVLKTIDDDIVILLNNDIKVDKYFIEPLAVHFKDDKVFYAAPKVLNFDGTFNGGRSYLKMRYGLIKVKIDVEGKDREGTTHTIACGAFRREMFLKLGGYDPIYLPGYWEDTDICYKALRQGLKGIYEPNSRIYHKEHASFSKTFSFFRKICIVDRNMFIFIWKNIQDRRLWSEHILFLIPRLLFALITGRIRLVAGFFMAFKKIPEIIKLRLKNSIVGDREIIK